MNDTVLDARDVTKTNTTAVQTFQSPNFGPLGYIHNGKIDYQRSPQRKHTRDTPFDVSKLNELPKVGIVYNYANASDAPAKALIAEGYQGIVSAGVGNGNLYKTVFDTGDGGAQRRGGGAFIAGADRRHHRRCGSGRRQVRLCCRRHAESAKARILLQLALTQTKDAQQIQQMFNQY